MLSRLFSGRTRARPRPPGHRGRRPQPGDLRLARGLGLQHPRVRGELPGAATAGAATYPLTVNRRSDERILGDRQPPRRRALRRPTRAAAARAEARRRPTARCSAVVHETYDDELAWLADQVIATHDEMAEPAWKEIGVLTRDNAHAAAVFDALSDREIPVEIVGLKGLLRLPEVAEVVATLTLVQDVTANAALLTLLAGPRWAIGPRDLALLGRRARELAGSQPARRRASPTSRRSSRRPSRAPTRPRSPRSATRSRTRATSPTPPRRASGSRLLADELRRLRAGDRRADPRPGPPDHRRRPASTSSWPRRSARPPRPGATTSTCSSRRSPSSRPSTARSRWPRCWPGWRPRTSSARASTWPPRPRPTRSSCSPSTAPRASSGTRCSWSASPSASSRPTAAGPAG